MQRGKLRVLFVSHADCHIGAYLRDISDIVRIDAISGVDMSAHDLGTFALHDQISFTGNLAVHEYVGLDISADFYFRIFHKLCKQIALRVDRGFASAKHSASQDHVLLRIDMSGFHHSVYRNISGRFDHDTVAHISVDHNIPHEIDISDRNIHVSRDLIDRKDRDTVLLFRDLAGDHCNISQVILAAFKSFSF